MIRAGRTATLLIASALAQIASACPFCTPAQPPFSRQREVANTIVVAELEARDDKHDRLLARQVVKGGAASGEAFELPAKTLPDDARPGTLWLLLMGAGDWTAMAVDETSLGYLLRAPNTSVGVRDRLRYFARYLEHADPLIAADAYREFAAASYDEVRDSADVFDMEKVRGWLTSESVPDERKGFYGLVLGLATDPATANENEAALDAVIDRHARFKNSEQTGDDFRAGFDGVVGGYLALRGAAALDRVDAVLLNDADAAEGNLRHVVTALRFAHEFLPRIPAERIHGSMRLLLGRPGFTAGAITDLARWRDAGAIAEIAALFDKPGPDQIANDRAVVGYLAAIDTDESRAALARLKSARPQAVAAAERYNSRFGAFGATTASSSK